MIYLDPSVYRLGEGVAISGGGGTTEGRNPKHEGQDWRTTTQIGGCACGAGVLKATWAIQQLQIQGKEFGGRGTL
jgi:hypothetical protein